MIKNISTLRSFGVAEDNEPPTSLKTKEGELSMSFHGCLPDISLLYPIMAKDLTNCCT